MRNQYILVWRCDSNAIDLSKQWAVVWGTWTTLIVIYCGSWNWFRLETYFFILAIEKGNKAIQSQHLSMCFIPIGQQAYKKLRLFAFVFVHVLLRKIFKFINYIIWNNRIVLWSKNFLYKLSIFSWIHSKIKIKWRVDLLAVEFVTSS